MCEPSHEKTNDLRNVKTRTQIAVHLQDSCAVTAQPISAFVFVIQIVLFPLYVLVYLIFQASLCGNCAALFVLDLVGNPICWLSVSNQARVVFICNVC